MKKVKGSNNVYDVPITFENILSVWNVVRRTCKNKKEVFKFSCNLNANIMNIYWTLKNRNYKPSKYRPFVIYEPKPRLVMSQCVFDKIINHFVAQFYLLPLLEKKLLDVNVATRKEKGSSYATRLVKKYVNKIIINEHPKEIYCLKVDVSKYFYSIDHDVLIKQLECSIKDKDIIDLIKLIISETNKGYINDCIRKFNYIYNLNIPLYLNNRGLSIGAMTSQFLGIYFLKEVDSYIINDLKCKYLIHYMDDFFLLDTDKDKLKNALVKIGYKLKELKLNINYKSNIYRLSKGVDFLGFNYRLSNNKLHISFSKKTYFNIKKKLNYLKKNDSFKYQKSSASYYGYFKTVNKYEKRDFKMKSMEIYKYYKEKYPNTLVIIKEGIFYSSYEEDANLIWYLFDYKNINGKVSFGVNAYDKVIDALKKYNLSFCVVSKENEFFLFNGEKDIYRNYLSIVNISFDRMKKEEILVNKVKEVFENNSASFDELMAYFESIGNDNV